MIAPANGEPVIVPAIVDRRVRSTQVIWLTVATTVLFILIMVLLGTDDFILHNSSADAPFSAGWGVVLVTMGGLLRELTARGL